jgi:hypothetical protein
MGDVKDNMKSTCSSGKDDASFMGKLLPRRKKVEVESSAETYADCIAKADNKIAALIAAKTADLSKEKGQELSNTLKIGNLKCQQMHIDALIELMNDYAEIK